MNKNTKLERIALLILLSSAFVCAFMFWHTIGYGVLGGWTSSFHKGDGTQVALTLRLGSAGRGFLHVEPYHSKSKLLIPNRKVHIDVKLKRNKGQYEIYRSNRKHTDAEALFAVASSAGYAKLEIQFMQPTELGLPTRLIFNRIGPS